jgi:hypothetical protein
MLYKLSFVVYKVKIMWPLFNIIALYFNLVLAIAVISLALYYQIAILWLIFITIYLI